MTSLLNDPLATLYAHLYEYVDEHVCAFLVVNFIFLNILILRK